MKEDKNEPAIRIIASTISATLTVGGFICAFVLLNAHDRNLVTIICFGIAFLLSVFNYICEKKTIHLYASIFILIFYIILTSLGIVSLSKNNKDIPTQEEDLINTEQTFFENSTTLMATKTVIQSTLSPTSTSIPSITDSSAQTGWSIGEIKNLDPMHVVIGDVVINGIKYYDVGGTGQSTIAVNYSLNPVTVYAEWGAGEMVLSDNKTIAQSQLESRIMNEFDSEYSFNNVRLVTISKSGSIEQSYYYKDDLDKDNSLVSSTVTPETSKQDWQTRETKALKPYHVVVGDVKVNGKVYYDVGGNKNESTIVVNWSNESVSIYAQWGAGEHVLSNDKNLAQQQLEGIISDEFNTVLNFKQIRLVTIKENGDISQQIIKREEYLND